MTRLLAHVDSSFVPPAADVVYRPMFGVVGVRLPHDERYGSSQGAEGLGSELFADEAGRLIELELELNPMERVDPLNSRLSTKVFEPLDHRRLPGWIELEGTSGAPLVADAIWMSRPWGRVVASFSGLTVEPQAAWTEGLDHLSIIQVAEGITVGTDARQGLALIAVDGFSRRQRLGDLELEERDGEALRVLERIELAYFELGEAQRFRAWAIQQAGVLDDSSVRQAILELVDRFAKDLAQRADVSTIEPDGV